MKAPITTHILNLHAGKPAEGVGVTLSFEVSCYQGITDNDGRVAQWDKPIDLQAGVWSITFAVEDWFASQKQNTFFADVVLNFKVESLEQHYHVPLLLNAHGFSTYRGS